MTYQPTSPSQRRKEITIVTPALHKRGGTENFMAYLVEHLCQRYPVVVVTGEIQDLRLSENMRVIHVPIIKWPGILRYLSFLIMSLCVQCLWRIRGRGQGEILFATGGDAVNPTVLMAHFCNGAMRRMVMTESSSSRTSSIVGYLHWLHFRLYLSIVTPIERWLMRGKKIKVIAAVSEMLKQLLVKEYGLPADRIAVVYSAVDVERFSPSNKRFREEIRRRHGISDNEWVVLFVGGAWERKGVVELIRAVSGIESRQIRLMVVGHGNPKRLLEVAEGFGIADRVVHVPPTSQVERYYGAADVLVLPTQFDTFGLVALEAMATGLPVIVPRSAGVSEILLHGHDAILIEDARDVGELRRQIERLFRDGALCRRIGTNARRTAERYTWSRMVAEVEAICARLLEPKDGTS